MLFKILSIALLLAVATARWTTSHTITGDASRVLANGIKGQLLSNMVQITDPLVKKALIADLNEPDDKKRTLTSITADNAATIFQIFQVKDPKCDKNRDGVVSGEELKCLGKIWKNFVPNG